jgi:hypothetical protein
MGKLEHIELDESVPRVATNHTVLILDQSGSMDAIYDETIVHINSQIEIAKESETKFEKQLSIVPFDDVMRSPLFWKKHPRNISPITKEQYNPNGMTALYDTIGAVIKRLEPDDIPGATFLVSIITDGKENNSQKYIQSDIAEMIQQKQNKKNWTFTYLGANQNLHDVAKNISIPLGNIAKFDSTSLGMSTATRIQSRSISCYYANINETPDCSFSGGFYGGDSIQGKSSMNDEDFEDKIDWSGDVHDGP